MPSWCAFCDFTNKIKKGKFKNDEKTDQFPGCYAGNALCPGDSGSGGSGGANTDVKIVVDGKDLTSQFNEDTLWMEDGITMAGVRALGEAVGADVRYDSATGSVVVEGLKQTTGVYSPRGGL